MNKLSLPQILFASATVLLIAAYAFNLHREASQEVFNNYSLLITILFVPAIASALCLLEYSRGYKKPFLLVGVASSLLAFAIQIVYIYFSFKLIYNTDFKLDTGANGLVLAFPLWYLLALALGALLRNKLRATRKQSCEA